jgi:hypothetical protein
MPYNFKIAMNATISSTVVEEMIRAAVENQTGKKITKIEIQMYEGKFAGYVVDFDEAKPVVVSIDKFDRNFKLATYQQ